MKTYRIAAHARELGTQGAFTAQTFYAVFPAWPSDIEAAQELHARGYESCNRTIERDRVNDGFIDGDTVRSTCEGARATFSPTWSLAAPWCTYTDGTAGQQFHSAAAAIRHLASKGYRFSPSGEETPRRFDVVAETTGPAVMVRRTAQGVDVSESVPTGHTVTLTPRPFLAGTAAAWMARLERTHAASYSGFRLVEARP